MEMLPGKKRLRLIHLLLAFAVFLLLFFLSYPYYRYFVDPDAVAYLTMAKRGAEGDCWRLVNALWSPLHPALVAVCIRFGVGGLLAAQLTNALACIGVITGTYWLFRRFETGRFAGVALLLAMAVFLVYALYKQLFCDLFQVALLLFYLNLITAKDFLRKSWKWLLCGIVMALSAYAKVYSFYFLLLHLPVALRMIKKAPAHQRFPQRTYGVILGVQILFLIPLLLLQHHKYGGWSLSKSGGINTSWTLVGHKTLRADISTLIPPPYTNSPYTWEDPYLAEGQLHSRFESVAMMKSQVGHSVQAALQGVTTANEISAFLLAVLIAAALIICFQKGQRIFTANHKILLVAAGIMPLGYLLLHFEARYIWLLSPVAMVLGVVLLEAFRVRTEGRVGYRLAVAIFAVSFIAYPLYDLKNLFRKGEDIYRESLSLSALGLNGSFTSNNNPSRCGILASWCGNNYYTPSKSTVSHEEVLADMRRYRVKYYYSYSQGLDITENIFLDEHGSPFPEVSGGKIQGLKIFLINP